MAVSFLLRREVVSPLSVFSEAASTPCPRLRNYEDLTGSVVSSTRTNWLREAVG